MKVEEGVNINISPQKRVPLYPASLKPFPPRGYLLIGHQDAGKTYLTKSLAANTHLSIVSISIEKVFFHNYFFLD